ncbi:MAG TPA: dTDP-4-dehydrorhamnose 3,5-epimerase [Anaerolineae bacterium]
MPFSFFPQTIPEVILVEPRRSGDARGFFMETYKRSDFAANGITEEFVQDNYSHSVRGVLRGLHYQKAPQAQGKLVMVLQGEVFDVAVDIRRGLPTFGRWVGVTLCSDEPRIFYVPPGFAHGFCVLSEQADFVYKVTSEYAPALERGILWNDPQIGVAWPIADPILSARDLQQLPLSQADL